ncbi:MAG TPA: urease accessory protein UreF [Devosia sp.]|nr:urease accessory protein UreF [Devosia sp.]
MATPTDAHGDAPLTSKQLLMLTQWLSPAFPVGAFAYSHGLEWAVQSGDVMDRASMGDWLMALLENGSARNDALFLIHAYRADSPEELGQVAELAAAFVCGAERYAETMEMGAALAKMLGELSGGGLQAGDRLQAMAYPVVLGVAARGRDIPVNMCVSMYLHAFSANLVSASQRLVPLGQVEGQKILLDTHKVIELLVPKLLNATLEELGGCAFRSDMAAMLHETQKVRLFRT